MPFLFVDYDQGAGGESVCANLSQCNQCVELTNTVYPTGRTKINDIFQQELLKPDPDVGVFDTVTDHQQLYHVVPTHRHTQLAQRYLGKISSIRIANPTDESYWRFLKHQQLVKVFLATEPSDQYFLGLLKILQKKYNNSDFIKKVKKGMDNLSLELLAQNIEPTEENKQQYIEKIYHIKKPEPEFDYDLVIPYEHLFCNQAWIKQQILEKFGIKIENNWLDKFQKNYNAYISKT